MNKKKIAFNLLVLLAITFGILFGLKVSFVNGDDAFLSIMMEGRYGTGLNRQIFAFIGPVFGIIEGLISPLMVHLNVYICTIIGLYFLAAFNTCLAAEITGSKWQLQVLSYLLYAFSLLNINFTSLTVYLMASALILAYTLDRSDIGEKRGARSALLVIIFISVLFAGSLRMSLAVFVLFFITLFMLIDFKDNKHFNYLISSGMLFVVLAVNYAVRSLVLRMHPDWAEYFKWHNTVAGFVDFPDTDYNKYKDLFDAVGWSQNDVDMLNNWSFYDLDVFTTDKMEYVLDRIPLYEHYCTNIKVLIRNMLNTRAVVIAIAAFIIALCIVAINKEKIGKRVFEIIVFFIPFAIIMGGLAIRQRIYPHVYLPFLGLLLFEVLLYLDNSKAKYSYLFTAFAAVIIVVFGIGRITDFAGIDYKSIEYGEYVTANSDQTFIVDNSVKKYFKEDCPPIIHMSKYSNPDNLVSMADFDAASPRDAYKLELAGIKDPTKPYVSLLEDDTYFISKDDSKKLGYLEQYFKEHFSKDIIIETVHDFGLDSGIKVYRFTY